MDAEEVSRLRRVVGRLTRELNASATGEGLTPTQASVLALVAARGPLRVAELIDMERVNPTMLSRVIGKLDQAGLMRRIPDPADQRAARVEITPEGQCINERIKRQRAALVSGCVAQLPAQQAATLSRAIPALEALVDRLAAAR